MSDEMFNATFDKLFEDLNDALGDVAGEALESAVGQIPIILQDQAKDEATKRANIEKVQMTVTTPFLNAAVTAAQSSRMDLGMFLHYVGLAWEQMRSEQMRQIAQEMLNKGQKEGDTE